MPIIDKYNEILIAIVAGIIIFLVITAMVVFILLFYQKKKFQHKKQIIDMEKNYSDELLKSQIEIQEQTFNHISQEIHDNVGQILSLAKVQINIMNESENLNKQMLDEVKENISKALIDLRDIAKSLSSERIKSMSIVSAVTIETERINKSGIIHAMVSSSGEEKKMDDHKKQILFRIIQECLQNIIKHAQASEVNLKFIYSSKGLNVCVKDNGKGFDVNKAMHNNLGLGLSNIKNRASLIGGALAIESTLNEGTTVNISILYE